MPTTVTLVGLSENFTAEEIESIVRGFGESVCGDGDSDSLSERQTELAERAYDLQVAEWEGAGEGPTVTGREHDQDLFRALRDHADRYGVQVTWTALYARLRSGELRMPEEKLLAFLGAYLEGRGYDPVDSLRRGWRIVEDRQAGSLRDGELFSVDNGITWHTAERHWLQVVSCYHGAGRGDDALMNRVEAAPDAPCQVIVQRGD